MAPFLIPAGGQKSHPRSKIGPLKDQIWDLVGWEPQVDPAKGQKDPHVPKWVVGKSQIRGSGWCFAPVFEPKGSKTLIRGPEWNSD